MDKIDLYTAQELESLLGKKYFYRQGIYRLSEENKINTYNIEGTLYFSSKELISAILKRLSQRISYRYIWTHKLPLRVKYNENGEKSMEICGFPNNIILKADTENETEEDLLTKVQDLREEVINMDMPVKPPHDGPDEHGRPAHHEHRGHHGKHHQEPHMEMMEILRRIEERLERLEERIR